MRVARINKIDCMQCDACVDICPIQAIHTDENGDYEVDNTSQKYTNSVLANTFKF